MAIDWNFGKLKQQALAKYDRQYWSNIASTYTNMGGRISWDKESGTASYNAPNIPLPSLPEMWGQYQKGAKSRGAVPDFMTFKKYYDQLKVIKNKQLIGSLQQAQLSGIPLNKIHDAIRTNPGFRDELVKTISSTVDENQRAALSQFVPPIEKTWGQVFTPGTMTGLTAAGLAGYGFSQGLVDDTAEGLRQRQTAGNFAQRERLKNYIANNPRPKAPIESNYKTAKGNWKKKGNTKAKYTKDQAAYQKKLSEWKANRPYSAVDPKITRGQAWMKKVGGPQSAQARAIKGAGAMVAPTAIGMLAESAGLGKGDSKKLEGMASYAIGAGYGASAATTAFQAFKSAPKGQAMKMISKAGVPGKIAMALWMIYSGVSSFKSAKQNVEAPQTQKKKTYHSIV